jgi:hypothetical protein
MVANNCSCLYHISVILLHRPYFTRGHLFNEAQAPHSFGKCAKASIRLAHIVNTYSHAFTVRRAPYFIAYSAYVALTILLRLAAYQTEGSVSQQCVHACLIFLEESERINAGVKRAMFVVSRLMFAVARRGPNPFPKKLDYQLWGQVITDNIEMECADVFQIIDSFSVSSPDAAAVRSGLESSHAIDPQLPVQSLQETSHLPIEMDNDSAAQLLASLRSNTPAISELQHTPRDQATQESGALYPDIIFGLHSDDALQYWPGFNGQLETAILNWHSPLIPILMTDADNSNAG